MKYKTLDAHTNTYNITELYLRNQNKPQRFSLYSLLLAKALYAQDN